MFSGNFSKYFLTYPTSGSGGSSTGSPLPHPEFFGHKKTQAEAWVSCQIDFRLVLWFNQILRSGEEVTLTPTYSVQGVLTLLTHFLECEFGPRFST
jgi:hypothetical protein